MKKNVLFLLVISFFYFQSRSQITITLQPNENSSKDASIQNINPNQNFGNNIDFIACAWTNNGSLSIMRSFIDFDFSSIPSNATILDATLSLYHYTSASNVGHSTLSGSNACYLQRITSNWDEMTITWNNQPSTTVQNQITIPESNFDTQDYPNINITTLIQDIINNPSSSFGMMMILQDENYYRSLLFSSSNNNDINKRPKLTITYSINTPSTDSCVTVTPNVENWKDACIQNIAPNQNFANDEDFIAAAWTNSGSLSIMRSLLKFEIPVPSNAIITSAKLSLYHYNSTSNVGHSTLSGSNSCVLKKITSNWDENTLTWNNQPNTTTQNQVLLPESNNNNQDYTNIDITNMVIDFYNNPTTNFGMLLKLENENYYRSLLFASKDCNDMTKRPKIEICYHINNIGVSDNNTIASAINVFPNPVTDNININYNLNENCNVSFEIFDMLGQEVINEKIGYQDKGSNSYNLNLDNNIDSGIYFIKINFGKQYKFIKFIKN